MNLGVSLQGFFVELCDYFIKDSFAGLVASNSDEEAEFVVVLDNWDGFFAEFFNAILEDCWGLIV